MQAYELSKLISKKESRDKLNLEFLKVPDLSMRLPKVVKLPFYESPQKRSG